jgi:hypothetical protein
VGFGKPSVGSEKPSVSRIEFPSLVMNPLNCCSEDNVLVGAASCNVEAVLCC